MEFLINAIPAIMPLIAAFIVCIFSFIRDFSINEFVLVFSIVVIVFYIIGLIVKKILRKQYLAAVEAYKAKLKEEEEAEAAREAEEKEAAELARTERIRAAKEKSKEGI